MKATLIAATALMILGAPLALAATNPIYLPNTTDHREHKDKVVSVAMDEKCAALAYQFDTNAGTYKTSQQYLHAMQAAAQGKAFCAAHNDTAGIQKYHLAFKMLGMKPSAT